MRQLLDASSQRIIKILETLIEQDDWTTVREIASITTTSERTAWNDISYIKKQWGQFLNIETSMKRGMMLHNRNVSVIGRVFIAIFNKSIALKWLEQILFHPDKGIEFYVNVLFVSESTLTRLLPRINRFLKTKGMFVQRRRNRFSIACNNELYLRNFFSGFLVELYGLSFNMRDSTFDLSVIAKTFERIIRHTVQDPESDPVAGDDIAAAYFIVFYYISLIRENDDYTIDSDRCIDNELDEDSYLYMKTKFPNICKKSLRPIHAFIFNITAGWDSNEEKSLLIQETMAFYQRVFTKLNIHIDQNSLLRSTKIVKGLYLVAKYRPYETSALFDRIYYFTLLFKKQNPYVYKLIEDSLHTLSKNIQFDLSTRMSDFVFWMCLLYPELSKPVQRKTILITSDFGLQHAILLKETISSVFSRNINKNLQIQAVRYQDIALMNTHEKFDIIITTTPELPIVCESIVLINDYPTSENICEIYRVISTNP